MTIDQALAADSRFEDGPVIWQNGGDVQDALAQAAHVIEGGAVELGGQEHFYLEGQAAAALPQDNGDMVVHSSTQHPTEIQHKVAEALDLPMHGVRVETRRMGGGGLVARKARAMRWPSPAPLWREPPAGPARCAMTATTT